jgi:hypothetical protein
MIQHATDPAHFTKVVAEFGGHKPVIATRPIFNAHGTKVLEMGASVNPNLYERLIQHRLSEPLEHCVTSVPSITPANLQKSVAEAIERVPLYERMLNDSDARSQLLEAISRIPLPDPIAFQLTLACEMRPTLYAHLVDTAIVSAWLAMDPTHPSHVRVVNAATVGLLHDIGMLHLNPILLDYRHEIDESTLRELYTHPLVSHVLTENQGIYPAEVLDGIRDHHEFMDGSGYPRGQTASSLGMMARILTLTELIVGAHAAGRLMSEHRLSIVLRMNLHRYDETLSRRVLDLLRPYPEIIGSTLPLIDRPAAHLSMVHTVLERWPHMRSTNAASAGRPHIDIDYITSQVQCMQHALARVGAAPIHLEQLGETKTDLMLHTELTLLVEEVDWQLRSLIRQIRLRTRRENSHDLVPDIGHWLHEIEETLRQFSVG